MKLKKGDRVEWCGGDAHEHPRLVGTVADYIETDYGSDLVQVSWDLGPRRTRRELRMNLRLVSILDKIVEALDG